ncbi:MAG: hypothetical protein KDD70_10605 [Bdellovibrionales bacterium]|nr:hypothetical protein [Bdellovibrionales bacterium]
MGEATQKSLFEEETPFATETSIRPFSHPSSAHSDARLGSEEPLGVGLRSADLQGSGIGWSVWLSTFGAANTILFYIVTSLIAAEETESVSTFLTGSRVFAYALVLSLLAFGASMLLIVEQVMRSRAGQLPHGQALQSHSFGVMSIFGGNLAALVASFAVSFVSIFLLFTSVSRELLLTTSEQAIGIAFVVSWWIVFRGKATKYISGNYGPCGNSGPADYSIGHLHRSDSVTQRNSGNSSVRLDSAQYSPARLKVVRGVALVRLRGGGKDELPVLRQTGDILPAGSFVVRGSVEGEKVADDGSNSLLWVDEKREREISAETNACAKAERSSQFMMLVGSLLLLGTVIALHFSSKTDGKQIYFLGISGLLVMTLVELPVLFSVFRQGIIRKLYQLGFTGVSLKGLPQFRNIHRTIFRLGPRSPLVGAAKVREFSLVDDRVDKDRLLGVVFALLRNSQDPALTAVREYCFQRTLHTDLFRVEAQDEDGASLVVGKVQGALFFIGKEEALVARGVQLEVSEAFYASGSLLRHYHVALGDEVVGTFVVEPPFFAEMPRLVERLRKDHIRPMLEGVGVDEAELDRLGKELGFELADIRQDEQSVGGSRLLKESYPRDHSLLVVLSPEESLPKEFLNEESQGEPVSSIPPITWFRESLWNLSFPGILMVGRELIPLYRLLKFSRLYSAILRGIPGAAAVAICAVFLGLRYGFLGLVPAAIILLGTYSFSMVVLRIALARL